MALVSATGGTELGLLLAGMQPVLGDDVYVFASVGPEDTPVQIDTLMCFEEKEGTTLIVKLDAAQQHQLEFTYPCRMITLNIHSSLEAVGFLAHITQLLAEQNFSVNAVSAFYHDHLFVSEDQAEHVLHVLMSAVQNAHL